MKISELISILEQIKVRGDLECWISGQWTHSEIKWVDYSNCNTNLGKQEHVCIKMKNENQ